MLNKSHGWWEIMLKASPFLPTVVLPFSHLRSMSFSLKHLHEQGYGYTLMWTDEHREVGMEAET
jgi:hypothetical protein